MLQIHMTSQVEAARHLYSTSPEDLKIVVRQEGVSEGYWIFGLSRLHDKEERRRQHQENSQKDLTVRVKALLEQHGLTAASKELPATTIVAYDNVIQRKAYSALILCLGDRVVGDLAAIDTAISDEDRALLLLTSLPSSYNNFVDTLLNGRDTLKLEDVLATLNSRELQKMTEAKGDGGEGLYMRGRSGQIDIKQDQVSGFGADGYDSFDVMMYNGGNILLSDGRECRIQGTCKVQVQIRDGSSCMLTTSVGQDQVTRKTFKGRKQLGEYQTRWKIKTGNGLDSYNQGSTHNSGMSKVFWAEDKTMCTYLVNRSPSSAIGFKTPIDMLGFFGWLASIKKGMLEPIKVKCIFLGYQEGMGSVQVLQRVEFEVERQEDHTFEVEPHGNVDHVAVAIVEKIYAHESLTFNNTLACEVISKWKAGLKDDMDARSNVYVLSNDCKKCSNDRDGYYWEYTLAKRNVLGMEIVRDKSGNTLRVSQSMFYNEKLIQTLLEGHSILSLESSLSGDCDVEKNGKWSCIYAIGSQEYQVVCTRLDIASADVGHIISCHIVFLPLTGVPNQRPPQRTIDMAYIRLFTAYLEPNQRGCGDDVDGVGGVAVRWEEGGDDDDVMKRGQPYKFLWILTTPWEDRSPSWEDRSPSWVDQSQAGYMTLTEAVKEAIWINELLTESRAKLMSEAIFCYWCLVKGDPCSEVPAMVEVAVYRKRLI
ncbi:hypothetical protein Tco_1377277 [Tanacetum coccineum]